MSISNPNVPKSLLALRAYTGQMFLHDLLAGVTVGLSLFRWPWPLALLPG
jgi:MFS superfamily sulfate permease-like transporter